MSLEEMTGLKKENLTLPALLVIMDGFGLSEPGEGNAISLAHKPCLDTLFSTCPHVELEASGEAVGLPAGQMGNSEVGHLNIGAGRVVYQELTRITRACNHGDLDTNPVLQDAFRNAAQPGSVLHFMGLMSDGGVHSMNTHLYALMKSALKAGVRQILVHCFMDGRDVPPTSGIDYIRELESECASLEAIANDPSCSVRIGSIAGRYYSMDRDKRWERVSRGYQTLVHAEPYTTMTPTEVMQTSYDKGVTDEFVVPVSLNERGIETGDSVVFFNFRPDRAREMTRALTEEEFDFFDRGEAPKVHFVCLTEYDPDIKAPIAFAKEFPENVLADVLAHAGLKQYHIAETEKYAHVTFFLNGGKEEPKENEERVLIPSPKVATYDLQPEMSEPGVAGTLSKAIRNDEADIYIVNFANCDMVGHTGIISAAQSAVEAVDKGLSEILAALKEKHGFALVTADHGNADKMIAEDGSPHTAHTTAPVPFILVDYTGKNLLLSGENGALCDIAPTLLRAIGINPPSQMTGKNLLA